MTDQSVGWRNWRSPARFFLRKGSSIWPDHWRTGIKTAAFGAAFAFVTVGYYLWRYEGALPNNLFTSSVTLTIAAVLLLISRRVLFSAVAVTMIVALVVLASSIKQHAMEMVLHAYDLFFYLSSWSTVSYLWSDHRTSLVMLVAALFAATLSAAIAFRIDGTRVPRRYSAIAGAIFLMLASIGSVTKGERRHTQFFWEDLYVSSFYASWRETLETLWRGQLIEAADHNDGPRLGLPTQCDPAVKPPHIILIHQESVVPPSLFPQLSYDKSVDPFFNSFDGKMRRMRVETYGGASWLTEFSILAGVSTYSFGGMRPFVQSLMQNKIRDTLPETLARCGYRNVVFYPMLRNFVSNDKFYRAVGLPEIFDLKDQGANSVNERDRFYYSNALDEIGRHLSRAKQPIFTFIQTMAAHSPYTYTYMPEVAVAGGGPGTDPEMSEYLRRLAMAKIDYEFLRAEIGRRFPGEPFLIVHYGDHQPIATRALLGFGSNKIAEEIYLQNDSIGYVTYYAVDGINYRPQPPPLLDTMDVPYLGLVVLEAARLPLSDAYRERKRLMALCGGEYYGCSRQDEILGFHRRMIDSGLIDAR